MSEATQKVRDFLTKSPSVVYPDDVLGLFEQVERENDKLRTFIRLKETCWKYVGWCDKCPYNGVDDEHDDCNCTVQEMVNSLARELGIESKR